MIPDYKRHHALSIDGETSLFIRNDIMKGFADVRLGIFYSSSCECDLSGEKLWVKSLLKFLDLGVSEGVNVDIWQGRMREIMSDSYLLNLHNKLSIIIALYKH